MKKWLKTCAICVLAVCFCLLGGCFPLIFDENSSSSTSTGFDKLYGYKLTYKNTNYELDDTFKNYCSFILTELYANFGLPNTVQNKSSLSNTPSASEVKNFDRIRLQVKLDDSTDSLSWKWTFSKNFADAESQTDTTETIAYYTLERQQAYFNEFSSTYLVPLQMVCMQIIMGQTPTEFTVEALDVGVTRIYYDTTKTQLVNENSAVFTSLKTEFSQNGKYIGFTEENLATFKSYLLNSVVGSEVIKKYNEIYFSGETQTYEQIIDNILALPTPLVKSFYEPYPTDFVKDITDASYYPKNVTTGSIEHITAYEYHSVTFMPQQEMELGLLSLAFESETDLDLTVKINYYSAQTGEFENLCSETIAIKANTDASINTLSLVLQDIKKLSVFNNELVGATNETAINNANGFSKYFSYSSEHSGLDEIENDFCEIVFINNDENSTYSPFKFGLSSILAG